jgi:hypothetical protein
MTNPMMTLNTLLEKTSDADILREMADGIASAFC